jgi:hypothetical protein
MSVRLMKLNASCRINLPPIKKLIGAKVELKSMLTLVSVMSMINYVCMYQLPLIPVTYYPLPITDYPLNDAR